MTPGTNQKRSVFGAIELATGRWLYHIAERATSTAFVKFLKQPSTTYVRNPAVARAC
jgi:hypothetical protein